MNKEFSAGAVVFKKENNDILFLAVFSNRNKIWGFPKGHLEEGETEKDAAAREVKEETGLKKINFVNGFREEIAYETISRRPPFEGQRIEKHAIYFLCELDNQDIAVDGKEITDHKFLNFSEAESLIKFDSLRGVLRRAHEFLQAI